LKPCPEWKLPLLCFRPWPDGTARWRAIHSFRDCSNRRPRSPNPTGQYENSSITQIVAGYIIDSRFSLQVNVPLIYREFKRPEGFAIDRGTVAGLGDVSLLLKTVAFHYSSPARRTFEVEGKNPIAIELHVFGGFAYWNKVSDRRQQSAQGRISRSGNSGCA
jgi:hypothetical protein